MNNVVKAAVRKGILSNLSPVDNLTGADKTCSFMFDLDAFDANIDRMNQAFPENFLHASAIKANPLMWFMEHRKKQGLGSECASIEEVHISLAAGYSPENIIFDSPVKTAHEIYFSLKKGVHLNIDNFQELEVVKQVISKLEQSDENTESTIGLRINPLVGAGTLEHLSVSTPRSKFAMPLPTGDGNCDYESKRRKELLEVCVETTFLSCIHVHSGSGGMGLKKLCAGVKAAVKFAQEVNAERKARGIKTIIDTLDIGGGIGVNFTPFKQTGVVSKEHDVFAEYAALLKKEVPALFNSKVFKRVITEFGASTNMCFADFVSRVEYTKTYKDHNVVCLHGGSDVFLRQSYARDQFAVNSVKIMKSDGTEILADRDNNHLTGNGDSTVNYDFVGPLCFAGDIVVGNVPLPKGSVARGDFVAIMDCGGNSFALKNMHCSRVLPAVYGYRRRGDEISFTLIKPAQTPEDIVNFWS